MTIHTTLVSAANAAAHLADPHWRIFDVRHDLFDLRPAGVHIEAGHIPGAQFATIDDDLSGTKNGRNGRHPLPQRDALVERFRAWGIDNDTQIVAYDAQGGQFAARLWWLARWLGHRAVAVLDGGWPAWLAADGPVSIGTPAHGRAQPFHGCRPFAGRRRRRAATCWPASAAGPAAVDARLPERYRGETSRSIPSPVTFPARVNRAWQQNLTADQRFKSAPELRAEFDALAERPCRPIGRRTSADRA